MGRSPEGARRGAWTAEEDKILSDYINKHGEGKWRNVPKQTGLRRCGKACRLRWFNYLRPDIKRGNITPDEVDLIIRLHKLLGNRWSLIAGRLPGRTDNEIKNYWNTNLAKREWRKESSVCQNEKMETAEAEFLQEPELKPRTDQDYDSNVAIVGSSYADLQQPPLNSTEENESNFLLDFDFDFEIGQITFSEFMDEDFTKSQLFEMNGLTSESAAFSSETTDTQVNWNACDFDKSSETDTPACSSEALWSYSDCFDVTLDSEQGSWRDFIDLAEECLIWD
ncbi:hypothetical protein L6164_024453 [Bauhinia variegata]|uniref:Uncharacterized protein n=1 Tax=Bauhinia variegata TaxID=167791 RepID=A0ACB9LZW4_BAUVA|nr:hypothetical protein L6164_024453 [Bauhinia variegata]